MCVSVSGSLGSDYLKPAPPSIPQRTRSVLASSLPARSHFASESNNETIESQTAPFPVKARNVGNSVDRSQKSKTAITNANVANDLSKDLMSKAMEAVEVADDKATCSSPIDDHVQKAILNGLDNKLAGGQGRGSLITYYLGFHGELTNDMAMLIRPGI